MPAKRSLPELDFVKYGLEDWPGDLKWQQDHGNIAPMVVQKFKNGWEDVLNKQSVADAGGLHPQTVEWIDSIHVMVWSRGRAGLSRSDNDGSSRKGRKAFYTCCNLHTNLHFTYPFVDDILNAVRELNEMERVCIKVYLYLPHKSHVDGDFLKVFHEHTPEWDTISDLYEELQMSSVIHEFASYGVRLVT
jgi:hypothetical protein